MTTAETIKVSALSDDDNRTINRLVEQLESKMQRNTLRSAYYDGKHGVRQVTAVLPPQYQALGLTLGWTAKAVDLLARRCNLEGFTWADGDLDSLGYAEMYEGNALRAEVDQGLISSLTHSSSFVVTTAGGPGEPGVVWQFFEATQATGDWNRRSRRLDSLLVVTGYGDNKRISSFVLYVPGRTITCARDRGRWVVQGDQPHPWHVPADMMAYKPRVRRPFGSSRITRPMMTLQDAAVRELLRLEGHMDVYSYPEMWMLGADPSIFKNADGSVKAPWQVMLGRIKGIPDDEDATVTRADVKQFAAASPAPHLADLNALSKLFAREASLPDSSLAITDFANPTSADAYDASQHDLIAEAEGAVEDWSPALQSAAMRSLAMLNGIQGINQIPREWLTIKQKWRNPRFLSRAAEADAGLKQLTAMPWLADTSVGLELLGLSPEQSVRALADRRRSVGNATLAAIASTVQAPTVPEG